MDRRDILQVRHEIERSANLCFPSSGAERAWARLTRRHRRLTGALLAASRRPRTARLIVPAASRMPLVFSGVVRALQ